ncbi:hypothetical protein K6025_02820 [Ehrlichia sp. JZT12]
MNKVQSYVLFVILCSLFMMILSSFLILRNGLLIFDLYLGLILGTLTVFAIADVIYIYSISSDKGFSVMSPYETHTFSENQCILFIPLAYDLLDTDYKVVGLDYKLQDNKLEIVQNCGLCTSHLNLQVDRNSKCKLFFKYKDIAQLNAQGLCIFFNMGKPKIQDLAVQHSVYVSIINACIENKRLTFYFHYYVDIMQDKETLKQFFKCYESNLNRYLLLMEKLFLSFPSDGEDAEKKAWLDTDDGKKVIELLAVFPYKDMLVNDRVNDNRLQLLNQKVNYVLDNINQQESSFVNADYKDCSYLFKAVQDFLFERKKNMYLYDIMFEDYFAEKGPSLDLVSQDLIDEDLLKYIFAIASYHNHCSAVKTNKCIRDLLNQSQFSNLVVQVDNMLDEIFVKELMEV